MAVVRSKFNVAIPEDITSYPRLMLQTFEEYGNKPAIVSMERQHYFLFSYCWITRDIMAAIVESVSLSQGLRVAAQIVLAIVFFL